MTTTKPDLIDAAEGCRISLETRKCSKVSQRLLARRLRAAIAAEREQREAVTEMAAELSRAIEIIGKAAGGYGHYLPGMRAALARYREAGR